MRFLSDLPFLAVGIAVAAFLLKLFFSLRVVSKALVWQEPGDKETGAANTDRAVAGIHTDQISKYVDALPDLKPVGQQSPEYLSEGGSSAV
jgi:hypothetical protein